ncbi:MAG: hypothetical protein PF489_10180, partial [Salinivirgaceae bacterium]|jgi:hypothetical protein|nr:hypothetical protein [Salinivirgaceae bacterium]
LLHIYMFILELGDGRAVLVVAIPPMACSIHFINTSARRIYGVAICPGRCPRAAAERPFGAE